MLLACINFMNLATARSQIRAKKVGVRNVVRANRSQFLSAAVLLSGFACVLGHRAVPFFNLFAGKFMQLHYTQKPTWGLGLLGFGLPAATPANPILAAWPSCLNCQITFRE